MARESAAQLFCSLFVKIDGVGERRAVLLFIICGDRWRGGAPCSSSVHYSRRSMARESAAQFFCSVFAEIDGAGERRAFTPTSSKRAPSSSRLQYLFHTALTCFRLLILLLSFLWRKRCHLLIIVYVKKPAALLRYDGLRK